VHADLILCSVFSVVVTAFSEKYTVYTVHALCMVMVVTNTVYNSICHHYSTEDRQHIFHYYKIDSLNKKCSHWYVPAEFEYVSTKQCPTCHSHQHIKHSIHRQTHTTTCIVYRTSSNVDNSAVPTSIVSLSTFHRNHILMLFFVKTSLYTFTLKYIIWLLFKDDMQRFFTKLMQMSFLAAYCHINLSV